MNKCLSTGPCVRDRPHSQCFLTEPRLRIRDNKDPTGVILSSGDQVTMVARVTFFTPPGKRYFYSHCLLTSTASGSPARHSSSTLRHRRVRMEPSAPLCATLERPCPVRPVFRPDKDRRPRTRRPGDVGTYGDSRPSHIYPSNHTSEALTDSFITVTISSLGFPHYP